MVEDQVLKEAGSGKELDDVRVVIKKVKPLLELTASDVPPGLESEDVATDC